jgi:CBS domain-containing protein
LESVGIRFGLVLLEQAQVGPPDVLAGSITADTELGERLRERHEGSIIGGVWAFQSVPARAFRHTPVLIPAPVKGFTRARLLLASAKERRRAMASLQNVLEGKGHELHVISPTETVLDAVEVMCDAHIGAVLVMDGDYLAGIFSERDLMTRVVLAMRDPMTTRIGDVMTPGAICAPPETSVRDAMLLMTERRVRHVPVVERRGRIVGVVSIGDLVSSIAQEREIEIEELHNYVMGRYPG